MADAGELSVGLLTDREMCFLQSLPLQPRCCFPDSSERLVDVVDSWHKAATCLKSWRSPCGRRVVVTWWLCVDWVSLSETGFSLSILLPCLLKILAFPGRDWAYSKVLLDKAEVKWRRKNQGRKRKRSCGRDWRKGRGKRVRKLEKQRIKKKKGGQQ